MKTRNYGPLFHGHKVVQDGMDRWFNICFAGECVRISDCVGDNGVGCGSFGYTHIPDLLHALERDGAETHRGVRWLVTLWGHRYVHEAESCQTGQLSLNERERGEFLDIVRRHLAGERIIYRGAFGAEIGYDRFGDRREQYPGQHLDIEDWNEVRSERNWGEMILMPGQTELRVMAKGERTALVRKSRQQTKVETYPWEQVFTFPSSAILYAPPGCDYRTASAAGLPIEALRQIQAKIEGSYLGDLQDIFHHYASGVASLGFKDGPLACIEVERPEITSDELRGQVVLRSDRRVIPFKCDGLELFNAIGPGEAARGIELGGFTLSGQIAKEVHQFFWGYA